MTLTATWIDRHREPQEKPNPAFPDGVDIDIARLREPACSMALPYPAKRCGYWFVSCNSCGLTAMITTAGRVDDPRSVKVPCKAKPS